MSSTSRKSETEPLRVSSAQDYRVPAIWLGANVALAAIAFALFLGRLVINHSNNLGDWGYSAGEWLINYQGGFVRRGLLGELLTLFPDGWQLTMTELWVAGVWLGVVAAFALLIGRTIRHTHSPWPLAFWMVISGFVLSQSQSLWQPFWVSVTQFPARKENLFYLLALVLALLCHRALSRNAYWVALAVSGLVLAASAFVHEAFTLPLAVSAAVLLGVAGRELTVRARIAGAAILLATGLVASVAVLVVSRQVGDADAVWYAVGQPVRTWLLSGGHGALTGRADAMSFLNQDAASSFEVVNELLIGSNLWWWWLLTAVLLTSGTALLFWALDRRWGSMRRNGLIFLGIAAPMLPLFVVAYDWGRFLAFILTLGTITALTVLNTRPRGDVAPLTARWLAVVGVVLAAMALVGLPEVGDPRGVIVPAESPADSVRMSNQLRY